MRPKSPARPSAARRFPVCGAVGLGGCLEEGPAPEPYIPPQLSAEALAESVNAVMAVVRSPHSLDWYDTIWPATAPLSDSGQEQAAVPALSAALGDRTTMVRRHAAFVLARLGRRWWDEPPRDIAAALTAALTDDDAQVREIAARGLRSLPTDPVLEASLAAASHDPSPRVRWAAIMALTAWHRSEAAAAPMLDAFDDPDPRTRYAAAFGLQRILPGLSDRRESLVDDLIAQMMSGDESDGHVAAYQMGLSGLHADQSHLPALIALSGSTDPVIRRAAASEILGLLLHQNREGTLDRDLLAAQLDLHRADLMHDDAKVRANAAWSLRGYRELDKSSLPDIEAALAVETDYETRSALRYVRTVLAGEEPDYSGDRGWTYHRDMCLPHELFAIMGLRPWDDEHKVRDRLGEPVRIRAGSSEDDGGRHIVLGYEYATLDIEIARTSARRIATRSPTVIAGGLRVGITRQDALTLLGVAPNPEALAARRFVVGDCDNASETALTLDFGDDGRVATMAIEGYAP